MSDMHLAYVGINFRLGMRGHSSVNDSQQFVGGTVNIPVDPSLGELVAGTNVVCMKIPTYTLERQWLDWN